MGKKTNIISVQDISITIASFNEDDYICITDMAKAKGGESRAADIIKNWIRNRSTLEFLGTWETLFNPDFKVVEFDHFKMQAGLPTFTLSASSGLKKQMLSAFMCRPVDMAEHMPTKILLLSLVQLLAQFLSCISLKNIKDLKILKMIRQSWNGMQSAFCQKQIFNTHRCC